jgi:hypothetical protein
MSILILRSSAAESAGSSAPAYFLAMTEKTWAAKAGSAGQRITDVAATGFGLEGAPAAICTAWTGGGVDQVRGELILAANGGHTDWEGNEVYAIPLKSETPAWVRLTDPSAVNDDNDIEHGTGAYSDGNIRSYHGYGRTVWGDGKIWTQPEGMWKNGGRCTSQWSFDRDSLGTGPFPVSAAAAPWTNHGEAMPTWGGNLETQQGPSAYDRIDNIVWNIAHQGSNSLGQSVWSVDCDTGTASRHALDLGDAGNGFPTWAIVAHDLRLLIIGCSQGFLNLVDLDAPTALVQKSTSGTPTAWALGAGAVYHQPSRAVFCWDGYGTSLRKLKIPADPISGSWVWSEVTAAGGGATPSSSPAAGAFGKFNIVDDMGNGQAALVVVNAIDEPTYVYRMPEGELS